MSGQEIIGLVMLCSMLFTIFIGIPISFTLLFLALVFGSIGLGQGAAFNLVYLQIYGMMKDEVLPALPLFIFMGFMVEQAGLMERLFVAFRNLLAPVRGSLYLAVIFTATIFAMATGIIGASVVVLGIMAAPVMMKTRYSAQLSAGAITAGGSLGILIPPSVMLVVMGPTMGVPVNHLYLAAFGPGFTLAAFYVVYCLLRSFLNPEIGPPIPKEMRVEASEVIKEFFIGILPVSILIGLVLGTIIAGVATTTEAASCGAFGSIILVVLYRKLTVKGMIKAAIGTLATSSMVMLLNATSAGFGAIFTKLGSSQVITNLFLQLPLNDFSKLIVIMIIIFILGWPFEWPAVILVFLPIFLPVIEAMNFGMPKLDMLLWVGALIAVNLQTAFLSPPVAMSAYYLKSVAPDWSLSTIYKGMFEFMGIQLIVLLTILFFPRISLFFVSLFR